MSVCCECCVLSCRGLCDKLITRQEETCRPCCVVVCDLETSRMRRPWPTGGCCAKLKKKPAVLDLVRQSCTDVTVTLHNAQINMENKLK